MAEGRQSPGHPPRSRRLAPDDLRLWHHVTRDVTPLRAPPPVPAVVAPPAPEPPAAPAAARAQPTLPHPPPSTTRRPAPLPDLTPGRVADLDRATAERLRRGATRIDARLDLHGLTQDEAHAALDRFLAGSAALGRRCLLVITGKGLGDPGTHGRGVLRQAVPRWLNLPPNRARILAVMQAQPKHGGAGALYVLLKRRRDG